MFFFPKTRVGLEIINAVDVPVSSAIRSCLLSMLMFGAKQLRLTQQASNRSAAITTTRELMLISATGLCTNRTAALELSRVAKIDLREANRVLLSLREAARLLIDKYGLKDPLHSGVSTENPASHQAHHSSTDLTGIRESVPPINDGGKKTAITLSDSELVPSKNKQSSQEEFWRGIRANGVTQSKIDGLRKTLSPLSPVNEEVMAYISPDSEKKQTNTQSGLDDDRVFDLSLLVSMFDSWSIDHGFGGLDKNDRIQVICSLLRQRGLADDSVDTILLGMISINPDYNLGVLRRWRAVTGFDSYVQSFCESIELPDTKYSLKSKNAKVGQEANKNLSAKGVIERVAKTAWIYPSVKEGKIHFLLIYFLITMFF